MEKRTSAPARVLATIALLGALLVFILAISSSLGGGGSGGSHPPVSTARGPRQTNNGHTPAVYVVKYGDTLTSIAHKTGVSVLRIQTLNPHVDPQILISGERLRLR
ncbi:MAG TPA: LysM domain-containing protein [Solirubrobacterales bacterium]|nr:LysM domain-containing protein [Solirubrobacterales bacterium]